MVVVKDENVQIVLQEFCDQLAKTASMFSGFENVLTGSLEQPEDRLELISSVNEAIRNLASHTHHLQLELEWGHAPKPEWYNHFLGIYYDWSVSKNPFLAERGVFSLLALKHGAEVLELCCGDGFIAKHFLSVRARNILSVDFDPKAIEHAKRYNHAANIQFEVCDIRKHLPDGRYQNVIWDGAIEHFTEVEIYSILCGLKTRLTSDGILSGNTIVERPDGQKSLEHHEYEFKSREDLLRIFTPHFKNVKVFDSIFPVRHNLYFYASDNVIPFDADWGGCIQRKS